MQHKGSEPDNVWLYVARRVSWRLLTTLYLHRLKVIAAIVAVLALGLYSLTRGGGIQGQAGVVGVMPVAVTVLRLEVQGDRLPLVLQERDGGRQLTLELGPTEARVIARQQGLQVQGEQPHAYNLFRDLVGQLGGRVDHVIIAAADDGAPSARIGIAVEGGDIRIIRARPADAVALALTTSAPVYVEGSIFNSHRPTI
jgi:bifunctional DNase/RNase